MKKENWLQARGKWEVVVKEIETIDKDIGNSCGFCKEYKFQEHPASASPCENCSLFQEFCGTNRSDGTPSVLSKCGTHLRNAQKEAQKLLDKIISLELKPEKTYYVGQHLVSTTLRNHWEYVIIKHHSSLGNKRVILVDITHSTASEAIIKVNDYEHITAEELQMGIGCELSELKEIKEEKNDKV